MVQWRRRFWARDNGLDLIITDHHQPGTELPQAFAVINPKRPDCKYPYKDLAGVGVALKLAQALLEAAGMGSMAWQDYLDLACLGTIADIVPVRGENRIIVKHGLISLARTENAGLRALLEVSGLTKDKLGPGEVGFGLAPRLNAAGRMDSPEPALRLLLSDSITEARELAAELNRINQERQKVETEVFEDIKNILEQRPAMLEDRVLVLASKGWHVGVIGIVAARLVDIYSRPVLLITVKDGEGKGSARSVPGFNLYQALSKCQSLLLSYGGHAAAAGFTIEESRIDEFRRELNLYAGEVLQDEDIPSLVELDGFINMNQVSEELVKELDLLQPFGHHNPTPLLGCRNATVIKCRGVGRGEAHLKMLLRNRNTTFDGIGFNLGAYAGILSTAEEVDIAFIPCINEYNGRSSIQLEVKEFGIPAVLETAVTKQTDLSQGLCYLPSKKITGNLEELFIPEFIHHKFRNLLREPVKSRPAEKMTDSSIRLEDWRGLNNRPGALAEIASRGIPTVILTSCGYRTIELAHFLQLAVPDLAGRVAFCHSSSTDSEIDRLVQYIKEGIINIIVSTPRAAVKLKQYARMTIIYDLPFAHDELCCAINTVHPDGTLYLLFNAADLNENKEALNKFIPDWRLLAFLYTALRQEQYKGNTGKCSVQFITGRMQANGYKFITKDIMRVCLNILEELGLLRVLGAGSAERLELCPPPRHKRDLMDAMTYKYLIQVKESTLSWMEKLLNTSFSSTTASLEI